MKKELWCILFIGVHQYAELFEQEVKSYQAQFKKFPSLPSAQMTNRHEKTVKFEQKLGFKKKKVEYTLALRY